MADSSWIHVPETPLCAAATDLIERMAEPALLNHVRRSFLYADWIGQQRGLEYDRELLYLATMLHDLGFTTLAPVRARFEIEGADLACEFLRERGMDQQRLDVVWDAIALHTTAEIPQRKRVEIALCQLGIAADVLGLPPPLGDALPTRELLGAHPWLDMDEALVAALVRLYETNPAAAGSHAVADACERRVPGFRRFNLVDVLIERKQRFAPA